MARKKPDPKPLAGLRFDFADALENVCNQSMMMLQAVGTILQHDENLKPGIRDILQQRHDALRNALIGKDV